MCTMETRSCDYLAASVTLSKSNSCNDESFGCVLLATEQHRRTSSNRLSMHYASIFIEDAGYPFQKRMDGFNFLERRGINGLYCVLENTLKNWLLLLNIEGR